MEEELIKVLFEVRVVWMDVDMISWKGVYEKFLNKFVSGEV